MGLVTCPDCKNRVSDRATACPNCGCPITQFRDELLQKEKKTERKAELAEKEVEKKKQEQVEKLVQEEKASEKKREYLIELRNQGKLKRPVIFTLTIVLNFIIVLAILINLMIFVSGLPETGSSGTAILGLIGICYYVFMLILLVKAYNWSRLAVLLLIIFNFTSLIHQLVSGLAFFLILNIVGLGLLITCMMVKIEGIKLWSILANKGEDISGSEVVQ